MKTYKNTKAMIRSPDGNNDLFDIAFCRWDIAKFQRQYHYMNTKDMNYFWQVITPTGTWSLW